MRLIAPFIAVALAAMLMFVGPGLLDLAIYKMRSARARSLGMGALHVAHFDEAVRPSRSERRAMHSRLRSLWMLTANESGKATLASFRDDVQGQGHDLRYMMGKYPNLKDAYEALDGAREGLKDMFDKARTDDGQTDLTKAGITQEELRQRVDELNELKDTFEGKRTECLALEEASLTGAIEEGSPMPGGGGARGHRSLGEMFVDSEAFKGYTPGAASGPTASLDLTLKDILILNTLFETGTGWSPEAVRGPRVELFATRPAPHVIDAIPQTETNQSAVKYMEETTMTNATAEVAEGGAYPEAALALTERESNVRKVGVWLPVTDEQFEDEPRARDYVNNRLVFFLRQRLDAQVLTGDGIAPNLKGTENVTGIQTQALGADPIFDAFFKLFRKIRDDGFAEPSVFFIRAANWEDARLARTADGIYILGNPADDAPVRMWGVPGLETQAAPATKMLTGDYRNFAELAARRGVDVQVTNAHADFFINGKLAIRADVRAAMIHYRPKAFGEVTGL